MNCVKLVEKGEFMGQKLCSDGAQTHKEYKNWGQIVQKRHTICITKGAEMVHVWGLHGHGLIGQ